MLVLPSIRRHASFASFARSLRRYSTFDAGAIERLKKPTRGGQNLSLRYRRLEQSLRGKEALQRDIFAREPDIAADFRDSSPTTHTGETKHYFHGRKIPQQPKPPESDGNSRSACSELSETYVSAVRVLHVRLRCLRVRPLRGIAGSIQGVPGSLQDDVGL